MIENYILFGVSSLVLILAILILIYLFNERRFERKRIHSGYNVLIFSFLVLVLISLIKAVSSLDNVLHEELIASIPEITKYIGYLSEANNFILLPLFGVCILVAVALFREGL